jgi:hypothetical protein
MNRMKNICILMLMALPLVTFSQDLNGKWSVGANFSYNNNHLVYEDSHGIETSSSKNNSSNSQLRFGYFVSNNFIVGIKGMYSAIHSNVHTESEYNINESSRSDVGVFSRYYHMFNESKFGYFLELNATYETGKGNGENNYTYYSTPSVTKTTIDITGYNISLLPGIVYFIHPKIALETTFALFYYSHITSDNAESISGGQIAETNNTTQSNGFTANFSLNTISLGVSYYFGKGK